jgi:hypothetical protein
MNNDSDIAAPKLDGSDSIRTLLEDRGAWLKGSPLDIGAARLRLQLTQDIAENYQKFELLRDDLLNAPAAQRLTAMDADDEVRGALLEGLIRHHVVKLGSNGTLPYDTQSLRFLSGGWLEEMAWHAAVEAGAHEAVYGQVLGWKVDGYTGENEIDVIMRCDNRLTFVSCKALKAELNMTDKKHRNRLMDAVHEADNLADHFGRDDEKVAVLVSTDLFDEERGVVRYSALMGKAAVLKVRIISLEDLAWPKLVQAMQNLMKAEEP